MRKVGLTTLAALGALVATLVAPTGSSAAPSTGKLKCFSEAPATCTINESGSSATLDRRDGGSAGVYATNGKTPGAQLSSVSYTFDYRCNPSNTDTASCISGGSPRWSIPISTEGNTQPEGYAFIDALGCGATGTVNNGPTCAVNFQSVDYPNWTTFAGAHPDYTIGNALPFVIADTGPFFGTIYNVAITKS
jgi:hypothetical protein